MTKVDVDQRHAVYEESVCQESNKEISEITYSAYNLDIIFWNGHLSRVKAVVLILSNQSIKDQGINKFTLKIPKNIKERARERLLKGQKAWGEKIEYLCETE